jgi:hypothetical protein
MIKILFGFFLVCLSQSRSGAQTTPAATAPNSSLTVDEIIQRHSDAMGGLENCNKVKTVIISGNILVRDKSYHTTIKMINGRAMRMEMDEAGMSVINVYKDGKGWKMDLFAGETKPIDVTGAELIEFKTESFLANRLMDYKKRGYTVELLGLEDVEGMPAYKINTVIENKREMFYFIDTSTFLVHKTFVKKDVTGGDTGLETCFYDFRDFGNIRFPLLWKQKMNGEPLQEVHFDKLELNAKIDEKIFDKPVK